MSGKTSIDTIVKVGGGSAVVVLALLSVASVMLTDDVEPGCMPSYQRLATFDLQSSEGAPLTPIELQARAGIGEVGIMQNARVVEVNGGPSRLALDVSLAAPAAGGSEGSSTTSTAAGSGIDFAWRPMPADAKSVCMRYSVFVPENFDYGFGGALPGLFGSEDGSDAAAAPAASSIRIHNRWQRDGYAEVELRAPAIVQASGTRQFQHEAKLARGRWTTFEQELVLNEPGQADGSLAVWIDGKRVIDKTRMQFGKDKAVGIEGVLASIGHSGMQKPESKAAHLQISPIELAWH